MDNVPFYKIFYVGEALGEAGHTLLRLLPCTPRPNATEYVLCVWECECETLCSITGLCKP